MIHCDTISSLGPCAIGEVLGLTSGRGRRERRGRTGGFGRLWSAAQRVLPRSVPGASIIAVAEVCARVIGPDFTKRSGGPLTRFSVFRAGARYKPSGVSSSVSGGQ